MTDKIPPALIDMAKALAPSYPYSYEHILDIVVAAKGEAEVVRLALDNPFPHSVINVVQSLRGDAQ
jgi:hypothetical protein